MNTKCIILGLVLFLAFPKVSLAGDDEEIKFGFYADRVMVSTQTILLNESLNKRITEIGNRVAKASDRQDMKYTFRVINDPTINAYSAAGGFVYINTGLLDILESEDELAAIMAHEIVHTSKNHQIDFIYAAHRRAVVGQMVGITLGAALGAAGGVAARSAYGSSYYTSPYSYSLAQQSIQQMTELGFKLGVGLGDAMAISMIKGYGKKQELEADAIGVKYTQKAGNDPNALISVFKKLISIRNRLGITPQNYISSLINADPGLEERIKNAELILNPDKNKQNERREE